MHQNNIRLISMSLSSAGKRADRSDMGGSKMDWQKIDNISDISYFIRIKNGLSDR